MAKIQETYNVQGILRTLVFLLAVFLVACNSEQKSDKPTTTNATVSNTDSIKPILNFYKHLVGNLANHAITMDLQANEAKITGSYFYNKVGLLLKLSGSITKQNVYSFYEIDPNGDTTGLFTGQLIEQEGLSGTWTNIKTKQQFSFELSERDTGFCRVKSEHYERVNCALADSIKAYNITEPEDPNDTLCTFRTLNLLRIELGNKTVSDKIYQACLDEVAAFADTEPTVEAILSVVDNGEQGFEDELTVFVQTNTSLILSVEVIHSQYWYGAAHPNSNADCLNFDLRTGELISAESILKPSALPIIEKIAKKDFESNYGKEREFFLSDDFTIAPGGLQFNYDPYEIGSYAEGYISVFIPYSKIRNYIKTGSVLDVWLKGM